MKKPNWTEKPVTWGAYATLAVVCYIIGMVMWAYYYIMWCEPTWWTSLKESVKDRFNKITHKE